VKHVRSQRNTESLGMQLVNDLTNQLGGTIEFSNNGKTEFKRLIRLFYPASYNCSNGIPRFCGTGTAIHVILNLFQNPTLTDCFYSYWGF
jgi:hypothetical protein